MEGNVQQRERSRMAHAETLTGNVGPLRLALLALDATNTGQNGYHAACKSQVPAFSLARASYKAR